VRGAPADHAREALAFTPEQLPVLKQAGVGPTAGGAGLLLFSTGVCWWVGEGPRTVAPPIESIVLNVPEQPTSYRSSDVATLRYEVMYLLDADDAKMRAFREVWAGIGDSIVIVGGDGLYNCHIHTDEIGAAIEPRSTPGVPERYASPISVKDRRGTLGPRGQVPPSPGP